MPSKLPRRAAREDAPRTAPQRTTVVYEYSASGRVGGLAGWALAVLVLAALVAFLVLGAITLTIVLWVALGAAVVAVLLGLVRALLGGGRTAG